MPKQLKPLRLLGLALLLTAVLIILKQLRFGPVAHWSWWAVTAPIWGPQLLMLVAVLGLLIVRVCKGSRA